MAVFPRKTVPIYGVRLSIEEVIRIYERLDQIVQEQGNLEVSRLRKPEEEPQEQWDAKIKAEQKAAFKVTVTISGDQESDLFGDDAETFRSPIRPKKITSIYMTNVIAYKSVADRRPVNAFELNLDFSKPPLFDSLNPVSAPTSNNSSLRVESDRDSWVAAVVEAVIGVTKHARTNRSFLHRAYVYDLGLMLFGWPAAFYVIWKLSDFISKLFQPVHQFVEAAAYVYVVFGVTWVYRFLFGYTKWAFPVVELIQVDDEPKKHRRFWYAMLVGLVVNFVWEAVK